MLDIGAYPDELPQHLVTLAAYEIARYPVTVAEYACFVRAGQREPQNWQKQLGRPDHPVVNVSWQDAVDYCAWFSDRTRALWRLPSEAEWEKAARGIDGRRYPWGNTFDQGRCNTYESGIEATTPVGKYPQGVSPFGAQDMEGNVWEWTGSLFAPYPYETSGEREDLQAPGNRVVRGGGWRYNVRSAARLPYRAYFQPDYSSEDVGFRVVRVSASS